MVSNLQKGNLSIASGGCLRPVIPSVMMEFCYNIHKIIREIKGIIMAELVYTYIEKMDTGIKNSEIVFSDKHKFKLKDRDLLYIEDKNRRFFGEKISNLSLIVGKNGIGKSSLLDLISFSNKNINLRRGRNSYFNIFHLRNNIFFIEGSSSLINQINNLKSNEGLFMIIGNNKFVSYDNKVDIELQISLIRSSPTVNWFSRDLYRYFNSNKSPIVRNVKRVSSAENVFRFIVEAKNSNVTEKQIFLKVSQKQFYSTNSPAILDKIYGNNRITNIENELEERLKRKLRLEEGENAVSFNSRTVQNYFFREHKEYFFKVQFLEKYLLYLIKFLEENGESRNKIYSIIEDKISHSEFIEINPTNLSYLLDKNNSEKFLIHKIDILKNIVNDLRDWSERIKYFEGKSSRDTPFIERDDLNTLISNFNNLWEYGYFRGGISCKIEVSSSSLKNKDINFKFIELLMVEFSDLFSVQFENLSDGEIVYFNTFSSIFMEIREASKDGRDCVLVLDEPDLNLHPEWCRRFIDDCITLVNNYSAVNVQFIIATHSPYMISDVPKENVFSLEEKEKMIVIKRAEKTFAANIIDILSDTFFLDYSIGEFARKKY